MERINRETAAKTLRSTTDGLTSAYQKTGYTALGPAAVETTGGYYFPEIMFHSLQLPTHKIYIGPSQPSVLESKFYKLVEKWRNDTRHTSSIKKMVEHPSYKEIIGLGVGVLPLLFQELNEHREHWLVALNAITGKDPAPPGCTFREAVDAWLRWGREKGYFAE